MSVRPALAVLVAGGALLPLIGGCSLQDRGVAPPTSVAPSSAAAPSTAAAASPSAAATDVPSPGDSGDSTPELVLQGDGLGRLSGGADVAALLFGSTSADGVRQAVEAALGTTAQVDLPTCPQGPRTALQVDGFTVLLNGDSFVGWTDAGAPDRSMTTADGIGTGSRLAELRSAVPDVQVGQDPAGATTFTSADGLSGLLTGPDPTAAIASLSGGETCPGP